MSQRVIRVNELVKREISEILHTRYQSETVSITISDVDISPDLRKGKVYYSVLGDEASLDDAEFFFNRHANRIKKLVGKKIVLKYLPHLEFIYDQGLAQGARLNDLLDQLD